MIGADELTTPELGTHLSYLLTVKDSIRALVDSTMNPELGPRVNPDLEPVDHDPEDDRAHLTEVVNVWRERMGLVRTLVTLPTPAEDVDAYELLMSRPLPMTYRMAVSWHQEADDVLDRLRKVLVNVASDARDGKLVVEERNLSDLLAALGLSVQLWEELWEELQQDLRSIGVDESNEVG